MHAPFSIDTRVTFRSDHALKREYSLPSDEQSARSEGPPVIGREFQLQVLERVLASSEEEVERAPEEARAAAIVEERAVLGTAIPYRFNHTFFQQTLYEEILARSGRNAGQVRDRGRCVYTRGVSLLGSRESPRIRLG
jgi:hypothetical protein